MVASLHWKIRERQKYCFYDSDKRMFVKKVCTDLAECNALLVWNDIIYVKLVFELGRLCVRVATGISRLDYCEYHELRIRFPLQLRETFRHMRNPTLVHCSTNISSAISFSNLLFALCNHRIEVVNAE